MYFLPLGMLLGADGVDSVALARNLVPVTLGNIVGGRFMVAAVYHLIYNVALKAHESGATGQRAPAHLFARRTREFVKNSSPSQR